MGILSRSEPPAREDAALPGAGFRDEVAERIADVQGRFSKLPLDEFKVPLMRSVSDACNAGSACRKLLWSIADDCHRQRQLMADVIDGARDAAKQQIAPFGHASPGDYEARVRDAQQSAAASVESSITKRVLDGKADDASELGSRFASKMQALSDAIDSAYVDVTGPRALREGASLERIMMLSAVEREMKAKPQPMNAIWSLFSGYVTRGGEDDMRKATDLEEAVAPFVAETLRAPLPKTIDYSTGRSNLAMPERLMAQKLTEAFADLRRSMLPPSIKLATECLQDLRAVFLALVGSDVRLMSRAEFAFKHLSPSDPAKADANQAWEVAQDWTQRALPSARVALPGWSPPIMRGQMGSLVRAPKGGR